MSMLYSDAKIYVARALGNSTYSDELTAAGDAIAEAIADWNLRNDWKFLLMDTRNGFTVAACTSDGANPSVVTTTTTNGFAGINIGQTVTGLSVSVTVASIASTTSFTASAQATGGPVTLTFTGEIPIISGTSVYNMPAPMKRPYTARLLNNNHVLTYKDWRELDRKFGSITTPGIPAFYMVYDPDSFATTSQNGALEVFPVPDSSEILRMRFFRPIATPSSDSENIDVPDRYIYALLGRAKYFYMNNRDSENARTMTMQQFSELQLIKAISDDRNRTSDREIRLVPYIEWGHHRMVDTDDVILVDW